MQFLATLRNLHWTVCLTDSQIRWPRKPSSLHIRLNTASTYRIGWQSSCTSSSGGVEAVQNGQMPVHQDAGHDQQKAWRRSRSTWWYGSRPRSNQQGWDMGRLYSISQVKHRSLVDLSLAPAAWQTACGWKFAGKQHVERDAVARSTKVTFVPNVFPRMSLRGFFFFIGFIQRLNAVLFGNEIQSHSNRCTNSWSNNCATKLEYQLG